MYRAISSLDSPCYTLQQRWQFLGTLAIVQAEGSPPVA